VSDTPSFTQEHRRIAISTPLGEDVFVLTAIDGSENMSQLFSYKLQMISEDNNIKPEQIVGEASTVTMFDVDDEPFYISGHIIQFSNEGSGDRGTVYQATLAPWMWFLTRKTDCRIFQQMTVPQILEEVFTKLGFSDFDLSGLTGRYTEREYCVQYRETDFNFVSRLMEQEGIFYYFAHEGGKHVAILGDAARAYREAKHNEVRYEGPESFEELDDEITNWTRQFQYRSGRVAFADFNFKTPQKPIQTDEPTVLKLTQNKSFELYDYPGDFMTRPDGDSRARVRMEAEEAPYNLVIGSSRCRSFGPGFKFTVKAHYQRHEVGKSYVITRVHHRTSAGSYVTGGDAPEGYENDFEAVPADLVFRPQMITPPARVHGPQTAIVVGPDGEEIYTDEFGRVKVQFHWDRDGKADEHASCWIRVSQPWAGKGWGALSLPRIGQEVVVDFLEGDPDRPLITGRVYNAEAKVPYELPKEKTKTTFKSDSSPDAKGFNEIRFEDKAGKEQIFIHAQKRMDLRVRGSLYETNYGNREERVGWEKDGESGGKHNTLVKLDRNEHVKEHVYLLTDKQLHQIVKEDVHHKFEQSYKAFIGDLWTLNAKSQVVETSDKISFKTGKFLVKGTQEISLDGTKLLAAGTQEVSLKGMQVKIEGDMGVSLKVGGNFVSITPAGVDIQGIMVNINSGGSGQAASKPSQAEAFQQFTPLEAIDAAVAKEAIEGTRTGAAKRTPRTNQPSEFTPHRPPPPPPPPKIIPSGGGTPVPVTPIVTTGCRVIEFFVKCSHNGRSAGGLLGNLLQVVPDRKVAVRNKLKLGPISADAVGGFGKDKVAIEAKYADQCGTDHPEIRVSGAATESHRTPKFDLNVTPPLSQPFWSANVDPKRYLISAESCAGQVDEVTVECFPPGEMEIELSAEAWTDRINPMRTIINKIIEELTEGDLKYEYLKGKAKGKWGWKEYSDHRAYHEVDVQVGFNPVVGFTDSRTKISVAKWIPRIIREHVADIYAFLKFSGAINLNATWKITGPESAHRQISGALSVQAGVMIGIEAAAGSEEILQVKVGAGISTEFEGKAEIIYNESHGPGSDLEVEWKGLKGEVYCNVKGQGWLQWLENETKAEIQFCKGDKWDPAPIYWFED
jgi:type VI secretion system secreted protein VgrG